MSAAEASPRYGRQVLFPPIGAEGQERLGRSRVVVVGCGALGATLGELLARSGVGHLRLLDRDVVEPSNLGRQALYTDADARESLPKAAALAGHLSRFNPEIHVHPLVRDLAPDSAEELLGGVDLILDGTDNFETRYLLNDFAVSRGIPWIYGACVGARGLTAIILPGETPCLRCLFPEPPPPGSGETCDTAGIIAPAATLVASLQAVEALKILTGARSAVRRTLLSVELWPYRCVELGGESPAPSPDCPCCGSRHHPFLERRAGSRGEVLCGRNAVQVLPPPGAAALDLAALETRLSPSFVCRRNDFVLRVEVPGHSLCVFDDGRALVSGTDDPARARALYSRYVGA